MANVSATRAGKGHYVKEGNALVDAAAEATALSLDLSKRTKQRCPGLPHHLAIASVTQVG